MTDNFISFWSGGRKFADEDAIRSQVQAAGNYEAEELALAHLLLLFDTSRQHTWLIATDRRLYCVLDDVRKDRPRLQWSLGEDQLKDQEGSVTVEISSADRHEKSGVVHIGPRRNWLYSKGLFQGESVVNAVTKLIENM